MPRSYYDERDPFDDYWMILMNHTKKEALMLNPLFSDALEITGPIQKHNLLHWAMTDSIELRKVIYIIPQYIVLDQYTLINFYVWYEYTPFPIPVLSCECCKNGF